MQRQGESTDAARRQKRVAPETMKSRANRAEKNDTLRSCNLCLSSHRTDRAVRGTMAAGECCTGDPVNRSPVRISIAALVLVAASYGCSHEAVVDLTIIVDPSVPA